MNSINSGIKVLVLGSKGMVGSSVSRILSQSKDFKVIESNRDDTNLFSLSETKNLFKKVTPDIVVNAAAKVGGILANDTNRTEFIISNLKINMNVIESLVSFKQTKLINLGSSCIYPLEAKVPISESSLMTGPLEPTNSPYAMAKLASIEMGDAISKEFGNKIINLMPTNLYGTNDNFSENESHVIPGLIHRMHQSKTNNEEIFSVWGTGKPLREFLFVDDLAYAILFLIENNVYEGLYNIGSNEEVSIKKLVNVIRDIVGYKGKLIFDESKPDGNPRKLLDSSKLNQLGWYPKTKLSEGLKVSYDWYLKYIA